MSGEKLYNIIEQYLEGNLDAGALAAFEQRLSDEPKLANEVNLHRKIQKELGNAPKRNLRSKLDQLREEFTVEEKENKIIPIYRKWELRIALSIAAGFLLFSLFIWLFILRNPDENKIVKDPTPPIEKEDKTPQEDPILKDEPTQIVADQKPDEKDEIKEEPIQTPEQGALASLTPNPAFENLISQNGGQKLFEFDLEKPTPGQAFASVDQKINFQISGILLTTNPEEENRFIVAVFGNQSTSNAIDQAKISFSLPLEKAVKDEEDESIAYAGKDEYFFDLEKELSLAPGLYYYALSQDSHTNVLYTGKFTVAEDK